MPEILLTKTATGAMIPFDEDAGDRLRRYKAGAVMRCDIREMRSWPFFKKWWALAKFAFDQWSETEEMPLYKGQRVLPAFERFRKDLTILAGYCHPVADINGGVHLEADSIAWANMTEEVFEKLYSATIDVVLQKILADKGYTEAQLRSLVEQTMAFT